MTLATDIRGAIRTNAKAALELVLEGADYRHTLNTVTTEVEAVTSLRSSDSPWVAVYAGDENEEPHSSQRVLVTGDFVVMGYVHRDSHRYPDQTLTEVVDEIIADIKKALNVDPSRGNRCEYRGRSVDIAFDWTESAESIFTITSRYRYRTNID